MAFTFGSYNDSSQSQNTWQNSDAYKAMQSSYDSGSRAASAATANYGRAMSDLQSSYGSYGGGGGMYDYMSAASGGGQSSGVGYGGTSGSDSGTSGGSSGPGWGPWVDYVNPDGTPHINYRHEALGGSGGPDNSAPPAPAGAPPPGFGSPMYPGQSALAGTPWETFQPLGWVQNSRDFWANEGSRNAANAAMSTMMPYYQQTMEYRNQELARAEDARRFDAQFGLGAQAQQWNQQMGGRQQDFAEQQAGIGWDVRNREFAQNMQLENRKQQLNEFVQKGQMSIAQADQLLRQEESRLAGQQQRWSQGFQEKQLGQQESQFSRNLAWDQEMGRWSQGFQEKELGQQESQFARGLSWEERQQANQLAWQREQQGNQLAYEREALAQQAENARYAAFGRAQAPSTARWARNW